MRSFCRQYWAIAIIVTAAAFLRLHSLGYDSFGHDESWRANWADHGGLAEARRFPPLKIVALHHIQRAFGRSEFALRLPYALAGIGCVVVVYFFTRRYVDEGSGLLASSVAAVHPILVNYSREIKVFSIEALMCVVLLWAGYEAWHKRMSRQLTIFLICVLFGLGFTYTGPLITAAWIPVLAWAYLRKPQNGPRLAGSFLAMAAVFTLGAGACYAWYQGGAALNALRDYYDIQETTWPTAHTPIALAMWAAISVKGIFQYVLDVRYEWPPTSWCIATVQLLAIALSAGVLWKRCRPLCIVLAILALEVLVSGAMRLWPIGRLRTMTFLIPIISIAIGCGLYRFVCMTRWAPATFALVGLCIGLPTIRTAHGIFIAPQTTEHIRPAIAHIKSNIQPGDAVFVYYGASDAFEFYAGIDEVLRVPDDTGSVRFVDVNWRGIDVPVLVEPVSDRQDMTTFAERFNAWSAQHNRVWFLFSHNWLHERAEWVAHLEHDYELADRIETTNASAHLFTPKPPKIATTARQPA